MSPTTPANTRERPFPIFGFQIDVARQIERPEALREAITPMADCGYNVCMLYIEDAYQYPRHPRIGRKHAYSVEFMQGIQSLCAARGMELIPVIPALGHCSYITGKPGYEHYDEGRGTKDCYGTLSPSFPETYDLLRELFEDWCLQVPGKYLHVGLDESPSMGQYLVRTQGAHKLDPAGMFAAHCNRLAEIAQGMGRRLIIWADMLYYLPQAIPLIDRDVIMADWYYYAFPQQPRVEAFNFADTDSSGVLKRAGFEVWGIPSVWPNAPFPPIEDRWRNLADWIRYGHEAGIDGIVISDWENSTGFYSTSDLLYRCFATHTRKSRSAALTTTLRETLKDATGTRFDTETVTDLCALGPSHLTGHCRRRCLHRPPVAMAGPNLAEEANLSAGRLPLMFPNLPKLMAQVKSDAGRSVLEAIRLPWTHLRLYWQTRAAIPQWRQQLLSGPKAAQKKAVCSEFRALAGELSQFAQDYDEHWDTVRYAGDRKPASDWAKKTADALEAWAVALEQGKVSEHPLVRTPLLQCRLRCRHPALPVAVIQIEWDDGEPQRESEVMIRFESAYAAPNVEWTEASSIPLKREVWPKRISFEARWYGEIGLDEVVVVWGRKRRMYRLAGTEGNYARVEGNTVWLGPVGADVTSPLQRPDADSAWFVGGP